MGMSSGSSSSQGTAEVSSAASHMSTGWQSTTAKLCSTAPPSAMYSTWPAARKGSRILQAREGRRGWQMGDWVWVRADAACSKRNAERTCAAHRAHSF
jgi:hypothetical protein